MPYVAMTLRGRLVGGLLPPRRIALKIRGSILSNAVGTRETNVQWCDAFRISSASNLGATVSWVPISSERVTTLSPPI